MQLSVVIPSYNAENWLPKTLGKLHVALKTAGIKSFEVIIVNDGSTDNTDEIVKRLPKRYNTRLISQENQGRYIARKVGIAEAKYENILLIDTRVFIDKDSLRYLAEQIKNNPKKRVWNAHVNVDKAGNIFARFWDAIVQLAWRKYFSNPREVAYGIKDFDKYPKGTTMFYAPKTVLIKSMHTFETETDLITKTTNDDTLIIREIAKHELIHISPEFSCLYHARTNLKQFLKHSFHRGQVFADGFLKPGNRFFLPLLTFMTLSALGLLIMLINPVLGLLAVAGAVGLWVISLLLLIVMIKDKRDALALWSLTPMFVFTYGTGIWRKTISLHRAYFVAGGLYAALLFYNFGKAFWSPMTALVSGPFDHTVLMWFYHTYSDTPWWQYSNMTNFPAGESIWNPIYITGQLQYIPFWMFAKLTNAFAAYNILVGLSMFISALIAFAFTRWLLETRSFWAPFFAGWAAVFTSYVIIKSSVHPSYASVGIVVVAIWLAVLYMQGRSQLRWISALALVTGLCFYYDVYFVLYCSVVLFALLLCVLIENIANKRILTKQQLLHGLVFVAIVGAFATPLLLVRHFQASQFESWLGDARYEKWAEAQAYGARPLEYVLPSAFNPLAPNSVVDYRHENLHGSSLREANLYIGVTMPILTLILGVLFIKGRTNKKLRFSNRVKSGVTFTAVLLVVAGVLSLAPKAYIAEQPLYFPSYLITFVAEGTWRVMARLALVVHICIAILGSVAVFKLLQHYKKRMLIVVCIVGLSAIGIFLDTMTFRPVTRYTWDFSQVPSVYDVVQNDQTVKAIAEYPMVDPPRDFHFIYYATYQLKHGKPLVNSNVLGDSNDSFRQALMNVQTGWQVPSVLKAIGADVVIIHSVQDPGYIPGLVYERADFDIAANNKAWLYRVDKNVPTSSCVIEPGAGFDGPSSYDYKNVNYYMHQKASLSVKSPPGRKECTGQRQIRLEFFTYETSPRKLNIVQDGQVAWSGYSTGREQKQQITFSARAGAPIEILPENPPADFSLVLTNMNTSN